MPAKVSIPALAERLRRLGGWHRRMAALLTGAAAVLAMAPFFAWPVLWLTLPALVWLMDGVLSTSLPRRRDSTRASAASAGVDPRRRGDEAARWHQRPEFRAAEIGWWFGFGYFLAGLFWIGEAFLVEAEIFAVLLPFAVTLLPAGLAVFTAAATGIAAHFWRAGPERVVVLALTVSAMEWARGHVLTGFPWNVLGYALTYPLPLMQSAAFLGIYGLTLGTMLIFALPLVLLGDAPAATSRRAWVAALAIAVGPLLVATLLGQVRLALAPQQTVPSVKLRIVQPSVPQREKWHPDHQERIFLDHLALSATNPAGVADNAAGITHVVWPEAAVPFLVLDHPGARAAIGRMLPSGTLLVTGALRAESAPPGAARPRRVFNSILVFGQGGSLITLYDKIHLVPFGEYLPLQRWLESIGLQQLSRLRGGFDVGVTPRPLLHMPGLPAAAPLICYEAVFPYAIVQGPERPKLMLNVTNDGWFGNTTGPRQHLHQARVRAVEEGIPLIRAANNGISAVIDAHGQVVGRLELDVRGVVDTALPMAAPPPPYARWGDMIFVLLWLMVAAAVAFRARSIAANDQI